MRNQTTKSHNAKSKILLITLCIFGLLFSYSCQCKNNVSDPNNIPPDGGLGGGGGGGSQTDTDPDKDLVDGALSTTSTKVIVVAGAGDTVKTTSTIKFKNATAKLTAIADVDASANTTLAVDDFDYTGTTLTFKKDTTDASKYDATTLAKVSWSGVDTKKVKATFSLTPTATNVDLTTKTQDVEIEIKKIQKLDGGGSGDSSFKLGEKIKAPINIQLGNSLFQYYNPQNVVDEAAKKVTMKNSSPNTTDSDSFSAKEIKGRALTQLQNDSELKKYFNTISFKDEYKIDNTVLTFTILFTINPEYELDIPEFTLEFDSVKGTWTDDINNPTPSN